MFEHIKAAPADPILGLGEAFKSETRENKINLGINILIIKIRITKGYSKEEYRCIQSKRL